MKFIMWVCDKCGAEVRLAVDQLPRDWVMVNVSSPRINTKALHWCEECKKLLEPSISVPIVTRRIKTAVSGKLIEDDDDEDSDPITEDEEEA